MEARPPTSREKMRERALGALVLVGFVGIPAVFLFSLGLVLGLLFGSSLSESVLESWEMLKILGLFVLFCVVVAIPVYSTWYPLKWAWKHATGEEGEEAEQKLINFLVAAGFSIGGVALAVWLVWGLITGRIS